MSGAKSDLVLHEGLIFGHQQSDSIAIAGGRIVACGRYVDLKALVGPSTHLIRLYGRTVAPGFIDSHLHFLEAASAAAGIQLTRARRIGELLLELRQAAARTAPGNWLKAFGCDEALVAERRGPTRQELDQAVPKNPLRLRHQTLHASWLNSRAIALLELERPDFSPPPGARLWRDENQRLTGLVTGMEEWLTQRLPRVTVAQVESQARNFSRELAAAGITAFTDATVRNGPEHVRLFARLSALGGIVQRISMMLGEDHVNEFDEAWRVGLPIVAVKFRGRESIDMNLPEKVKDALRLGIGCAFHATELHEVEGALLALESAHSRSGLDPGILAACRIEHGGVITADQVARIAALRAWVVTNPGFLYYRGAKYLAEPGLIPYTYRCRSLTRAGIRVAGASDAPVTPAKPLAAIAAASHRLDLDGNELAPEERLNLPEAFGLFTDAASDLVGLPAGRVQTGALADLIVLPQDLTRLSPAEIADVPVDMTIVNGQVVYERGRPATYTGIPET